MTLSLWSQCALGAYYYATLPVRRHRNEARAQAGRAPISILFYHRISNHTPNDWTMTESQFARQLGWLQANFDLISLTEAQQRIRSAANVRPSVSITFDDGYADNCEFALPLLIRQRIPVTYFVSSQFILRGSPFPHDAVAGAPLPPNSLEQLRSLIAAGVEIGAHTRTHADLGKLTNRSEIDDEVIGGREELSAALGCPIRYFAFPYGLHANLNRSVFAVAESAGFAGVCSAYGGYNYPGDDAFHLQRIHADPELIRLKNWLSLDPRKERRVSRYEYQSPVPPADTRLAAPDGPPVGPVLPVEAAANCEQPTA